MQGAASLLVLLAGEDDGLHVHHGGQVHAQVHDGLHDGQVRGEVEAELRDGPSYDVGQQAHDGVRDHELDDVLCGLRDEYHGPPPRD